MGEDLWPDMLPEVEEVATIFGPRWFGILRDRNDQSVRWRSPPYTSQKEATDAAALEYFNCFDR